MGGKVGDASSRNNGICESAVSGLPGQNTRTGDVRRPWSSGLVNGGHVRGLHRCFGQADVVRRGPPMSPREGGSFVVFRGDGRYSWCSRPGASIRDVGVIGGNGLIEPWASVEAPGDAHADSEDDGVKIVFFAPNLLGIG